MPDPTPDNRVETTFEEDGAGTLNDVAGRQTREVKFASGMEHGMEAGYVRLELLLSAG